MKHPKEKGRRHELDIAQLLREFGWKASRTPLSGGIEGWKGDITAPDFSLFIEAKNVEGIGKQFLDWYKKAKDQAGSKIPTIVWTKNHEQIYAFLLFTDLLGILKKA